MVPFQKIKRRISRGDYGWFNFINLTIVGVCILAGYLITIVSDSTQNAFEEIKEIESVVSDIGGVKNMADLKEKVRKNPKLLDKVTSSKIEKLKSNPLFKRQIEEKLKELK